MDNQQFNQYWKNYHDAVVSLLIRKITAGNLNISMLNNEVESFSKRWKSERTAEGLWVNNLAKEDSQKAEAFLHLVSSFHFTEVSFEKPTMLKYHVYALLISVLSIIVFMSFSLSIWKKILLPVLAIMLAYGFFIPMGKGKIDNANKELVSKYSAQFDNLTQNINRVLAE